MRSSASKLLEHPWLFSSASQSLASGTAGSRGGATTSSAASSGNALQHRVSLKVSKDVAQSSTDAAVFVDSSIANMIKKHQEETAATSSSIGQLSSASVDASNRPDRQTALASRSSGRASLGSTRMNVLERKLSYKLDSKSAALKKSTVLPSPTSAAFRKKSRSRSFKLSSSSAEDEDIGPASGRSPGIVLSPQASSFSDDEIAGDMMKSLSPSSDSRPPSIRIAGPALKGKQRSNNNLTVRGGDGDDVAPTTVSDIAEKLSPSEKSSSSKRAAVVIEAETKPSNLPDDDNEDWDLEVPTSFENVDDMFASTSGLETKKSRPVFKPSDRLTIAEKGVVFAGSSGKKLVQSNLPPPLHIAGTITADDLDGFDDKSDDDVSAKVQKPRRTVTATALAQFKETVEDDDNFDDLLSPEQEATSGIAVSRTKQTGNKGVKTTSKAGAALPPIRSINNRSPHVESVDSSSIEMDDFIDDNDGGGGVSSNQLAEKLKQRMKLSSKSDVGGGEDENDEFMKFDETDFQQNEQKDADARRCKEITVLMKKIKPQTKEFEVIEHCKRLMQLFHDYPLQRNLLIDSYGVMPIIDMFEARSSIKDIADKHRHIGSGSHGISGKRVAPIGTTVMVRPYVLRVINKIIEGSVRAQEQLSLMGLIPAVMSLFLSNHSLEELNASSLVARMMATTVDNDSNHSSGNSSPRYSSGIDSDDDDSSSQSSCSSSGELAYHGVPPRIDISVTATRDHENKLSSGSQDPHTLHVMKPGSGLQSFTPPHVSAVTMEAAVFIHQIASASSLTLQMLIGAGGLAVITAMVAFGMAIDPRMSADWFSSAAALAPISEERSESSSKSTTTSRLKILQPVSSVYSSSTFANFELDDISLIIGAADSGLNPHDKSLAPSASAATLDVTGSLDVDIDSASSSSLKSSEKNSETTTVTQSVRAAAIFQMGIDCVMSVFAAQSSRTRDFCRLFVKLGLLPQLSVAFRNILPLYLAQVDLDSIRGHVQTSSGAQLSLSQRGATGSMYVPSGESKLLFYGPLGVGSSAKSSVGAHTGDHSDNTLERKYLEAIATLFFKFSRSDQVVVETMANHHRGVVSVIVQALRAPELRKAGIVTPISRSMPTTFRSKTEYGDGSTPASARSNIDSEWAATPAPSFAMLNDETISSPVKSFVRRKLTPAYCDLIDLLLKTLKNLSGNSNTFVDLERAKTIETLMPLLSGPLAERAKNHIIPFMFNMFRISRISRTRQDTAAKLGIVPILKKVISDKSHLRQFALQILLDLPHASPITREELYRCDCVKFFVGILKEHYWQKLVINSLGIW